MKKECFKCDVDIELASFFKEFEGRKPNFWSFAEPTGDLYLHKVKNKNFLILKRDDPMWPGEPTLYLSFNIKSRIVCLNYKMSFSEYGRIMLLGCFVLFFLLNSLFAFIVVIILVGVFFFIIDYYLFLDEVKNTNKEIKLFFKKKGVVLEPHQCIGN